VTCGEGRNENSQVQEKDRGTPDLKTLDFALGKPENNLTASCRADSKEVV
jgi:hypothetical protein